MNKFIDNYIQTLVEEYTEAKGEKDWVKVDHLLNMFITNNIDYKSLEKKNKKDKELMNNKMSVQEFLAKGYLFVEGDTYTDETNVYTVGEKDYSVDNMNTPDEEDYSCFIVKAKALEKAMKIKTEYVKLDFDTTWRVVKAFEEGVELYTNKSSSTYAKITAIQDVLQYQYRLYKKTETPIEWWDDIDESGVLCWVSDYVTHTPSLEVVVKHSDDGACYNFEDKEGIVWDYATPLTREEITVFWNNAVE